LLRLSEGSFYTKSKNKPESILLEKTNTENDGANKSGEE